MAVLTPRRQPHVSVAGDSLIPRFPKKALGAALGAVVAGLVLTAGQAKALTVTVRDVPSSTGSTFTSFVDYEIQTVTGAWGLDGSNVGGQNLTLSPWTWNNAQAAFARAVGYGLGAPNIGLGGAGIDGGPFFAYIYGGLPLIGYTYSSINGSTSVVNRTLDTSSIYTFAYFVAPTPPPTSPPAPAPVSGGTASVPGPLPILGLAAAFGFSRKLRKRIKLHKGTSAVSTSPAA